MATQRSYHDACGTAHALDLVGDRWALLVVRELLLGPKRFGDLMADLPGISTSMLSHRLSELEQAGVLGRQQLPRPASVWVYALTDWGAELEPVIRQLGRWGARSQSHRVDAHLSSTSYVMSLRTNFDPLAAGDLQTAIQLLMGGESYGARVSAGALTIERGALDDPIATLEGAATTLAGVTYGGRGLDEAAAAGELRVAGDAAEASRFLAVFTLPPPA